jgi:hypothetical protein
MLRHQPFSSLEGRGKGGDWMLGFKQIYFIPLWQTKYCSTASISPFGD